jgi:putative endonuclease
MNHSSYVYTLASRSRTLYTGVTNDLERRMIEHRSGVVPGFTSRFKVFRLVHFEVFADIVAAFAREKEIKGWRREKKIRLIESKNPTWVDLAANLPKIQKQIPHPIREKRANRVRDDERAGLHVR